VAQGCQRRNTLKLLALVKRQSGVG
jgi:hypothetical protein